MIIGLWLSVPVLAGVKVGEKAPDFSLNDENGQPVQLSDYADKIVVLEWTNPECPFVKRHLKAQTMKKLSDKYKGKVVWLAINSTHFASQSDNLAYKQISDASYAVLQDQDGTVGRAYAARTTPHMFVVNQGIVAYAGAIDDNPNGDKTEVVNYVDQALDALLKGEAIKVSSTKPYGCSVKYK